MTLTRLLLAVCAAATLAGCPPPDEGLGGLDTLSFTWQDPLDGQHTIQRPLAVDTRGVVQIETRGGAVPMIRDVGSDDLSVLRVLSVDGPRIHIEGVAPGRAHLEVFTDQGNDYIELEVQPVDRVRLEPRFTTTRVLIDGVDVLRARRFGPGGGELAGHAPLAPTLEPADAGSVLPSPSHELRLSYTRPGEVRVRAARASLRRIAVERAELALLAVYDVPDTTGAQSDHILGLAVYDGDGLQLGALDGLLAIEVADEGVCAVRLIARHGSPALSVEARRPGRCAATLTLDAHREAFEFSVTR